MKSQKNTIDSMHEALVPETKRPYTVPINWCWTTVGAVNTYDSCAIDPSKFQDTMFELYSVPSSVNNYPEIISGNDIGSTKQCVKLGDVLLCKINPRINRVWKVSKFTDNDLLASSEWVVVRNDELNSDYLMWYFRSPVFRKILLKNVSGVGGSLMRAQPKYIKTYPIPIPPITEQKRIVDRIESLFSKLDEVKDKVQSVLDGMERRKAAILHKAFTGELTKKWREAKNIKIDEWKLVTMREIVSDFKYGTSEKSDYSFKGMPVFRIPNITDQGLSFEDMKFLSHSNVPSESQIHEGDILIIRSNGSRDLVGKSVLVPKLNSQYAYASFLIRIRVSSRVLPEFLVYFLNSSRARMQMFKKAKSSAGINNINSRELGSIKLNLPSITEQVEILKILNSILQSTELVATKVGGTIQQIESIKNSILSKAFRGELGTNDPSEESSLNLLKQILEKS